MLADANRLAKSFGDLSVVRLDFAQLILGEALFYHLEWVGGFFIFTGRRFALLAKVFTKGNMGCELIDEGAPRFDGQVLHHELAPAVVNWKTEHPLEHVSHGRATYLLSVAHHSIERCWDLVRN
jgi:hypothetical protein